MTVNSVSQRSMLRRVAGCQVSACVALSVMVVPINIVVGAFLGGFLFNLFGVGGTTINNNDFSLSSLLVSFVGAVVLLGIINLFRRSAVR
jgi:uncharacterized membrane protein YeaQ/YmgE (transglycosylase-associated protein family)